MASIELVGRPPSSFFTGTALRGGSERGGGLCFASLQAAGGRRRRPAVGTTAPVGALAERVVVSPAPVERAGRPEAHPQSVAARAVVTVRRKRKEDAKDRVVEQFDAFADKLGMSVQLQLVSTEMDPSKPPPTSLSLLTLSAAAAAATVAREARSFLTFLRRFFSIGIPGHRGASLNCTTSTIRFSFFLPSFLSSLSSRFSSPASGKKPMSEYSRSLLRLGLWRLSWRRHVQMGHHHVQHPTLTPPGLRELRLRELANLRGDGTGERRMTDRVYDYDVYNDLGNPDNGATSARPVLGGEQMPYPRRMRTGRPSTATGNRVEYPEPIYVSRDEEFEEGKNEMLSEGAIKALLHNFMPLLVSSVSPDICDFAGFHDVDNLFKEGLRLKQALHDQLIQKIPFVRKIQENSEGLLRYDTPDIIKIELRGDDRFLYSLRAQEFPPVSRLDPAVYGSPESAITEEHIIGNLDGMSDFP
ncbi:hypothetical protein ABZP36_007885 [Zizania latifolia]